MVVFPLIVSDVHDYNVADTVDFVAATGDKIDFDFVASRCDRIDRMQSILTPVCTVVL